jgi:Xaa-Pro aminopeptidase
MATIFAGTSTGEGPHLDTPNDPRRPLETPRLRLGRLQRLREHMASWGVDACVLLDPINIRYATGARNMTPFMHRNPARYAFVPLNGPVVMFEAMGANHLAEGIETIDEVRPSTTVSAVAANAQLDQRARQWADELAGLIRQHCGNPARVGVERVYAGAARALESHGFTVLDAQQPMEQARARKLPEEIPCIRASAEATMDAVRRLEAAIEPGRTENEVWSHLHASIIEQDGDYVETRLFNSGPRTNPWFQESSPRPIEAGDLVALDTDVVGTYGYYTDFSRTFLAGNGEATAHQRELYRLAHEEVEYNTSLIRPGRTFRELAESAWQIPDRYFPQRYFVMMHGCGMTGEYPYILHARDFDSAYDGLIEENMVLCVESYIGEPDGREGVKLENEYLVTAEGVENLTPYPFDERLLGPGS